MMSKETVAPRAERRRQIKAERKAAWHGRSAATREHARLRAHLAASIASGRPDYGPPPSAVARSKYMPHIGAKQWAKGALRREFDTMFVVMSGRAAAA